MREEFKIMDENLESSHKITMQSHHKAGFYSNALKQLNDFEKVVLIKAFFQFRPSYSRLNPEKGIISEDDYWLHLRNIAPFTKVRQRQNSDDVRIVLNCLSERILDTQEKIESLAYFIHYYKAIAKRIDIKSSLVRMLKDKIDEDNFPIFETILSTKISKGTSEFNIFSPAPEVKLLVVPKSTLFEQVFFSEVPQAHTDNYNNYLETINRFLLSPDVKDTLNISRIDYNELTSTNQPARIYIQANSNGFKYDIQKIYGHLVKDCSNAFMTPNMDEFLKKSLNYLLLTKAIPEKEELNEETKPTKIVIKV